MAKAPREKHEKSNLTIDRKWFRSRMDELGLDRERIARAFDVQPYMVTRMITGERPVRLAEVAIWAKALEAHPVEVLRRLGLDVPAATVPVIGALRGSGRVVLWPAERTVQIESPRTDSTGLSAIRIDTAHSPLGLHNGGHLYYEPTERVEHGAWSRLSIVELGDEAAPVVGVLERGASMRGCRVQIFGGQEVVESEQLQSAAPVMWHRLG